MEIDEQSRFRLDYVRVKIACRDVLRVPRKAEGTLGLCVHDFIFEREVQEEETVKVLSSGRKVGDGDYPPNKKSKADDQSKKGYPAANDDKKGGKLSGSDVGHNDGKQKTADVISSAPPKINARDTEISRKLSKEDSTKGTRLPAEWQAEKVHIPDRFDDSDAESESLSEKIRKLEGYGDLGQGTSKQGGGRDDHQVLYMSNFSNDATMELMTQHQMQKQISNHEDLNKTIKARDNMIVPQEQEDEGEVDVVINTQESSITMVNADEQGDAPPAENEIATVAATEVKKQKIVQVEKRRSERLKREIHVTTQEKMEAMAKKRCLEGNSEKPTAIAAVNNDQLKCLAKDMSVMVHDDNFATFNLIKEIEAARQCLYDKQVKRNPSTICDTSTELVENDENACIKWYDDDSIESEDFMVKYSKEKRK